VFLPLHFTEILAIFTVAGKERLQIDPTRFDNFPATLKLDDLGQ
jgi:hypothetical protein